MKENKEKKETCCTKEKCCSDDAVEKQECCCASEEKEMTQEEILQLEIEKLQSELKESQNAYYKAYADTENLKKRLLNDADTLRKYRIQSFAQEVLPVMDNLKRALDFKSEDKEVQKHIEGLQMIYQQLKIAFENEGVTEIECVDQVFDPNVHQALVTEKKEGVKSGIVLEEIQKGYKLKDRVIRASLVKVSE